MKCDVCFIHDAVQYYYHCVLNKLYCPRQWGSGNITNRCNQLVMNTTDHDSRQ